ncbi:MAG: hypothetical protein ACLPUO_22620 [Streptosporangiaceae bacterium]
MLDVAITLSDRPRGGWEVSALAIGRSRGLRRQPPEIVPWYEHRELFEPGGLADQLAELRDIFRTGLSCSTRPSRPRLPTPLR